MLMGKLVPHFVTFCHDYYIATTKVFIKIVIYKSGDQHVNKLTDNDFNKLYTDHFVVTFLNPTYYAGIMLNALTTYYAQNYTGIIGLGLVTVTN